MFRKKIKQVLSPHIRSFTTLLSWLLPMGGSPPGLEENAFAHIDFAVPPRDEDKRVKESSTRHRCLGTHSKGAQQMRRAEIRQRHLLNPHNPCYQMLPVSVREPKCNGVYNVHALENLVTSINRIKNTVRWTAWSAPSIKAAKIEAGFVGSPERTCGHTTAGNEWSRCALEACSATYKKVVV